MQMWRFGLMAVVALAVTMRMSAAEPGRGDVTVTFMGGYDPDWAEGGWTRQILKVAEKYPRLSCQKWGGITLPGGANRASFMMSLAGGTAPDIYYCWFHIIRHDIEQGFLFPLNEWIGDDTNGNGQIDDDEARWEGWKRVPPLWRLVATENGKVYGVPFAGFMYFGIVYRKDLVIQAGMDPEHPPETWEEFFRWCQNLTLPAKKIPGAKLQRGQSGFGVSAMPWAWLPWMQSAGGSPIIQIRQSPTTGKDHVFPMEAIEFRAPDTGEDLNRVPSVWRANFDAPEAVAAAEFYHRLVWAPWIRDADTGKPVDLTPEDLAAGRATADGRDVPLTPENVIRGVARALSRQDEDVTRLFMQGEVAAFFASADAVEGLTRDMNLRPDMIGVMPFPARDASCRPVLQAHKHFFAASEGVGRRPKDERDLIWKCLEALASEEAGDDTIRQRVLEGNAMWCRPQDLRRLGLDEYVGDVPPGVRRNFERVDRGDIVLRTEPFAGFWMAASDLLERHVLSLILAETGEVFDADAALRRVNADANRGLMFQASDEQLAPRRGPARILFGIGAIVLIICVTLVIREQRPQALQAAFGSSNKQPFRVTPWLMLTPALLSIALWSYYPLLRGVTMAFQDYKIIGETRWVGLDNFILAATDAAFWASVGRTLKFVFWTLSLGFLTPILLALMLSEIPRGRVFYRTLYFLPQMTSGLVIALLWRLMYDPTENGMLNQIMAMIGLQRQTWLQDPALAMVCCIVPGVWAGAGIASLIYIAALHSLPPDYYEAAAMDGAGIYARIRHVAIPQILPLMVINFVGAFIGAFQGMGSIFLLTFGGPGDATNVLSLAIWKEAYNNLRFGMATTMAWFLGVGLIGFTYLQIRILRRVEFRRAATN